MERNIMEEKELEELRRKFLENNTPEKLEARLRKISLENQSDLPAHLIFSFISIDENTEPNVQNAFMGNKPDVPVNIALSQRANDNQEPTVQNHYLPANDSGWLPYFVPGILNIEYNNQQISIDITQPRKEYRLNISPNYLITSSVHKLENY